MKRHNLFVLITKGDKTTFWHNIGTAFPAQNGNGWQLHFNSLPLPNERGKVVVHMFEDKPRPQDTERREAADKAFEGGDDKPPWDVDDLDDDIPF